MSSWLGFTSSSSSQPKPLPIQAINNVDFPKENSKKSVIIDTNKRFREYKTVDEKLAWLESSKGQEILSNRPRLNELYKSGKLQIMLHSPEWVVKLNDWLDEAPDIMKNKQWKPHIDTALIELIQNASRRPIINFPQENKLNMLVDGYTIIKNVIPQDILFNAIKFVNYTIGNNNDPDEVTKIGDFTTIMSGHPSILSLYYYTDVVGYTNSLLHGTSQYNDNNKRGKFSKFLGKLSGADRIESLAKVAHGQIALRFPELEDIPKDRPIYMGGKTWHIDGIEKGKHSAFTLLVGVALSDQLYPYYGNLCVHPGSHYTLQSLVKEFAFSTMGLLDDNNNISIDSPLLHHQSKPDLGEPVQILLKAGDVVFVHHKVAHRGGLNYSSEIRRMVYFRVNHNCHDDLAFDSLDNIWLEFEGLSDVL